MKKIFWVFFLILISAIPVSSVYALCNTGGTGIVPCGQSDNAGKIACPCEIGHFFVMLANIYDFIVWWIATPLAILAMTIGGIMLMISAGNPNLAGLGKKTLYAAIIGLVLVFGSWLIINFILGALGYNGKWSVL